jgi:hypothetical protein
LDVIANVRSCGGTTVKRAELSDYVLLLTMERHQGGAEGATTQAFGSQCGRVGGDLSVKVQ